MAFGKLEAALSLQVDVFVFETELRFQFLENSWTGSVLFEAGWTQALCVLQFESFWL